jgi:Family of unknown function (DUF6807)
VTSIDVGGRCWRYAYDAPHVPYCHPVTTPAGHVLSRDAPANHPWHHGLWFTIKYVNGDNFWETLDDFGVIRHADPPRVDDDSLVGALAWIRPDGETVVLDERRRLTHTDLDASAYAIDFSTELEARGALELDRTPYQGWGGYSGLAFRGRADFHDTGFSVDGGEQQEQEAITGERGRWLDLSGLVGGADGDAPAGLAIFDAPTNPNHPVPWYGHTSGAVYGEEGQSNFCNAAFLWDGPRSLTPGETLAFDYRVIVHDGVWSSEQLAAAYDTWTEGASS